jgi:chorismate mutase
MYRNDPHWSVPIELHRVLPNMTILSDPSHIGGSRELIAALSQQALDLGFEGLMVECHPEPDMALSDASQQITPEQLEKILGQLVWRRTPVDADSLRDFRLHIDSIDSRLIELLAERMEVARGIGELKRRHGMAIVQRERFNKLLESAENRAMSIGLSQTFIHQIFSAIHEESVRQQIDEMKKS